MKVQSDPAVLQGSAFVGATDNWAMPYLAPDAGLYEGVTVVSSDEAPPGTRALLYLRVSTPGQVNKDFDPEGISLPAQRS
ncbi:hypothetical protein ACW9HQ_44855, partial [Nocardia gipuzkoensis]